MKKSEKSNYFHIHLKWVIVTIFFVIIALVLHKVGYAYQQYAMMLRVENKQLMKEISALKEPAQEKEANIYDKVAAFQATSRPTIFECADDLSKLDASRAAILEKEKPDNTDIQICFAKNSNKILLAKGTKGKYPGQYPQLTVTQYTFSAEGNQTNKDIYISTTKKNVTFKLLNWYVNDDYIYSITDSDGKDKKVTTFAYFSAQNLPKLIETCELGIGGGPQAVTGIRKCIKFQESQTSNYIKLPL